VVPDPWRSDGASYNLEIDRNKLTDMILDGKISKEAYDEKYDTDLYATEFNYMRQFVTILSINKTRA
jgi:hypothetical protein